MINDEDGKSKKNYPKNATTNKIQGPKWQFLGRGKLPKTPTQSEAEPNLVNAKQPLGCLLNLLTDLKGWMTQQTKDEQTRCLQQTLCHF